MTDNNEDRLRYVNAAEMAGEDAAALIILDISREEIEAKNTASVLERLEVLTSNAENLRRHRESLVFQVRGYDEDPRVIFEVPEIRDYFADLADAWPHWLWFLHRRVGMVVLFMSLLCRVEAFRDVDGSVETEFLDTGELKARLFDLFSKSHPLLETFQVAPGEVIASAQSAANEISGG